MLKIIILAGGMATRLYPVTIKTPKSLIEIAGKPFIYYQLNYLKKQGIENIIICIGNLGELIQNYVGNGSAWGLNIEYSHDGPNLIGTGGAIKKALPLVDENFFVLYGDSYLPIGYKMVEQAFLKSDKMGLMTVYKNNNEWDRSNVIYKNCVITEYNKNNVNPEMNYIDYGLSVLNKRSFKIFNNIETFDVSELFGKLAELGQLEGYEVYEIFHEVGSINGISNFNKYLKSK